MNYYLCIDLKSFYASCECVERGLDPMKAKLVVADPARGRGAICLAVSPALKQLGVKNRCRIYEIRDGIDYIVALPRMKLYMEYSVKIYSVYLKYITTFGHGLKYMSKWIYSMFRGSFSHKRENNHFYKNFYWEESG